MRFIGSDDAHDSLRVAGVGRDTDRWPSAARPAARREVRRVEVAPGAQPLRSLAPLPSVNAPPVASILKRDADEAPDDVPCALLRPRARVSEPASADAAALRARADAARRDAQRWAAVAEALWDAAPMDD